MAAVKLTPRQKRVYDLIVKRFAHAIDRLDRRKGLIEFSDRASSTKAFNLIFTNRLDDYAHLCATSTTYHLRIEPHPPNQSWQMLEEERETAAKLLKAVAS